MQSAWTIYTMTVFVSSFDTPTPHPTRRPRSRTHITRLSNLHPAPTPPPRACVPSPSPNVHAKRQSRRRCRRSQRCLRKKSAKSCTASVARCCCTGSLQSPRAATHLQRTFGTLREQSRRWFSEDVRSPVSQSIDQFIKNQVPPDPHLGRTVTAAACVLTRGACRETCAAPPPRRGPPPRR